MDGLVFSQGPEHAADIMADRPGRVHDSQGPGRHAMEYTSDPSREREKKFVKMLCEELQSGWVMGKFDRLILVAAPQALGDLRRALGPELKDLVHGEIAKDLTHIPNTELSRHLESVLAI